MEFIKIYKQTGKCSVIGKVSPSHRVIKHVSRLKGKNKSKSMSFRPIFESFNKLTDFNC